MRSLLCVTAAALAGCQPAQPPAVSTTPAVAASTAEAERAPSAVLPPTSAAPAASEAPAPPPPAPVSAALEEHAPDERWKADMRCDIRDCDVSLEQRHAARAETAPVAVFHVTATRYALRVPYDDRLDISLVVTKGKATVTDARAPQKPVELGAWSALSVGAGGVSIKGDARVVVVVASANGKPMHDVLAPAEERKKTVWTAPSARTFEPIRVSTLDDLAWGGGAYHARIIWGASEHPKAAVSAIVFSHDASVKEHDHDDEWECLSVVSGEGTLTVSKQHVPVVPGEIVCVPPGKRHAWTPSGKAPLVAVQIYSPGGPEQRFKKLSGKR